MIKHVSFPNVFRSSVRCMGSDVIILHAVQYYGAKTETLAPIFEDAIGWRKQSCMR